MSSHEKPFHDGPANGPLLHVYICVFFWSPILAQALKSVCDCARRSYLTSVERQDSTTAGGETGLLLLTELRLFINHTVRTVV